MVNGVTFNTENNSDEDVISEDNSDNSDDEDAGEEINSEEKKEN